MNKLAAQTLWSVEHHTPDTGRDHQRSEDDPDTSIVTRNTECPHNDRRADNRVGEARHSIHGLYQESSIDKLAVRITESGEQSQKHENTLPSFLILRQ